VKVAWMQGPSRLPRERHPDQKPNPELSKLNPP
jgi:hypothetical protein